MITLIYNKKQKIVSFLGSFVILSFIIGIKQAIGMGVIAGVGCLIYCMIMTLMQRVK
jgi:hypothetical protein